MEKRISLECGNTEKSQVVSLNLDHCKASQIEGLTDDFTNLQSLSLINAGLTTLKGFPKLPKLRKLELADNFIAGGLNCLADCLSLEKINLSGNKIKDLEALKPLTSLPHLQSLDLFSNEIAQTEGYPQNVLDLLPNLRSLCDEEEEDISDDDDDEEDDDEKDDDYESDDENEEELPSGISSTGGKYGAEPEESNTILDGDDSEVEEEDEEGPGLDYLYKNNLDDNEEDEEFDENEVDEEDDEEDLESDEEDGPTPAKQAKNTPNVSSAISPDVDNGQSVSQDDDGDVSDT